MKIGVLSDTRMPTTPSGNHGLGRLAVHLSRSLSTLGHTVTLYAGPDSAWDGALIMHGDERARPAQLKRDDQDVWVDLSHYHDLSKVYPDWPVINYLMDAEMPYHAPRLVCCTQADARDYFGAKVVMIGIDVDEVPFNPAPRKYNYLAFAAKIIAHKGYRIALDVHEAQGVPVHFAGERYDSIPLEHYRGVLHGSDLYEFLGNALGVFQLSITGRGGGLVTLDALACGTPVLCLDELEQVTEQVQHCETGYICRDADELVDAINDLTLIKPQDCRAYVADRQSHIQMGKGIEALCKAALDGERW